MPLEAELERLRRSLSDRAAIGDQLGAKREMEHFVSYISQRQALDACAHFERAGWSVDASEGQDTDGRFPIRVYKEQAMDAHSAEHSLRAIYAINEQHEGRYDDFGAVLIMPEGAPPPGFLSRLLGRQTDSGENL